LKETLADADVLSLSAADIPGFAEEFGIPADATVLDGIHSIAKANGSTLTREEIRVIYEETAVGEFVNKQLTGLAGYVILGIEPELPTVAELKEVFNESVVLLDEVSCVSLSEGDIAAIHAGIDKAEPLFDAAAEIVGEQNIGGLMPKPVTAFISPFATAAFFAGAAVLALLIFLCNKMALKPSLRWCGLTLAASGLTLTAAARALAAGGFFDGDGFARTLLRHLSASLSADLRAVSVAVCAAGLCSLLLSVFAKRKRSS
jgi:hypothetical protein